MGVHRRPHPGRCALQTRDGFIVIDLTRFEVSQHRIHLVELELLQVKITEEIRGKGTELLGRFDQPVQHGGGVDLEHPRRGTDTQAFSQTGQDAHDEFHRRLFAMKDGAVMFGEIALARGAVQLPPGAAIGMAIGPQIVHPQPAAIVTLGVGTKVHRGVHGTGAAGR